jgi:antitoxin ParD1/3/4
MNVSLTPELEQLINEKVASGLYTSASEVVREGLRLLRERDAVRELRRDRLLQLVDRGIAELEEGAAEVFDQDLRDEIKRAGRQSLGRDDR